MKRSFISFIILAISLLNVALAQQNPNFSIEAKIKGIKIGDTLRFNKIILPKWDLSPEIDIIVKEDNYAYYSGYIPNFQLYMMEYLPAIGKAPICDRKGKAMLLTAGNNIAEGEKEYIYYVSIDNSIYDPELKYILFLEDSLGKLRGDIRALMTKTLNEKDTVNSKIHRNHFIDFTEIHKNEYKRYTEMLNNYNSKYGNEYTASSLAQESYKPLEELKKEYEKLSEIGKNSYYGKYVKGMISNMEQLAIGKTAPDVELICAKGEKIKISDFKGKYLLIYHFGTCLGSMQIQNNVVKLYNENREKLNILGITESLGNIQSALLNTSKGEQTLGVNIYEALYSMLNTPWKINIESSYANNNLFNETYCCYGLPYFIFISPEGKIISREIGIKTFDLASKTLAE